MQWNRLVVNLWSKMSLFCSMKEGVSYLFLSATTYLLFCHVQPPPRSTVPHVCCRPSNGRKMQALTAVEWFTAVRYETDGRLANGWTDGLPENRLTGLGAGLPLTTIRYKNIFKKQQLISFDAGRRLSRKRVLLFYHLMSLHRDIVAQIKKCKSDHCSFPRLHTLPATGDIMLAKQRTSARV